VCICSWHTLTHTHARVESIAVSLCSEKRQTIIITRLHAPRHHRHKSGKVRNGHLNYYRYGDKRVGWRSHIWHTYYITLCDVLYIIIQSRSCRINSKVYNCAPSHHGTLLRAHTTPRGRKTRRTRCRNTYHIEEQPYYN
jgi:hypothetical protein